MEIAANVHAVPLKGARAFLISEERLTLIDAGLAGSRPAFLRYLARIGRSIDELDRIICTHGHPDHVGGVRELADGAWVEVFVHPADLAGVKLTVREALAAPPGGSLRGRLLQAMTPTRRGHATQRRRRAPGPRRPRGHPHPGHTPGSVCLYARGPRILFTGDVLQVRRGHLAFASPIFSHDHAQARASVSVCPTSRWI